MSRRSTCENACPTPPPDARAVSTVLDVTVCLLLVSASVLTFVAVSPPEPIERSSAADAATLLAGTTATVNYSLSPDVGDAEPLLGRSSSTAGTATRRTAHGSVASLLARAALANATVDGRRLSASGGEFATAVGNASRARLRVVEGEWQVAATWRPTPGGPVEGRATVGAPPPPGVDVHAATLRVPVAPHPRLVSGSWRTVSADAAAATVRTLFPPDESHLALLADPPTDRVTALRYHRSAAALGADLDGTVAEAATHRANQRLAAALAPRLERSLRQTYETPAAAALALSSSLTTVVVTVRTWSA
ncbi:DUF7284 family protein [Haloarchaeobius sp. TZWWS8]|uniref:DUF7284 family protein n=1 Tax=Haloarchaeobius sp. TZWWS8 TaxID=3446121 RepID=UPI003EB9F9C9